METLFAAKTVVRRWRRYLINSYSQSNWETSGFITFLFLLSRSLLSRSSKRAITVEETDHLFCRNLSLVYQLIFLSLVTSCVVLSMVVMVVLSVCGWLGQCLLSCGTLMSI